MATGKEWLVRLGFAGAATLATLVPQATKQAEAEGAKITEKTEAEAKTAAEEDASIAKLTEQVEALTAQIEQDSLEDVQRPTFETLNDSTIVVGQDTISLKGRIKVSPRDGGLAR